MFLLLTVLFIASLTDDAAKQLALLIFAAVVEGLRELRSFIYRRRVRKLSDECEEVKNAILETPKAKEFHRSKELE